MFKNFYGFPQFFNSFFMSFIVRAEHIFFREHLDQSTRKMKYLGIDIVKNVVNIQMFKELRYDKLVK